MPTLWSDFAAAGLHEFLTDTNSATHEHLVEEETLWNNLSSVPTDRADVAAAAAAFGPFRALSPYSKIAVPLHGFFKAVLDKTQVFKVAVADAGAMLGTLQEAAGGPTSAFWGHLCKSCPSVVSDGTELNFTWPCKSCFPVPPEPLATCRPWVGLRPNSPAP